LFIHLKTSSSSVSDIADELLAILPHLSEVQTALAEAADHVNVEDFTLSYLDAIVVAALECADDSVDKPYNPRLRIQERLVMSKSESTTSSSGLRFSSYQQSDDILLSRDGDRSVARGGGAMSPASAGPGGRLTGYIN
jgi:hypothetical protein